MDPDAKNIEYISEKLNPLMQKLVRDILLEKPENLVAFMKKWLDEKGDEFLETGTQKIVEKNNNQKQKIQKQKTEEEHSQEDSAEEEEEPMDLPVAIASKSKGQRSSVSAEVYGKWNQKQDYKPRVVPKTELQKSRIEKRLEQAFMFSCLDENEKSIVIGAMEEKKFEEGQDVIRQGDDGDLLYVVDHGTLDCFKTFKGNTEPTYLKTYHPGESFGELSLLYNAPRAATIRAKTHSVLFALDRECFSHIVKDASRKKRDQYETFLSKVDLLESMDPYERSQIADALATVHYKKGDFVIRQGERGDAFFIVEEGELVAKKQMQGEKSPIDVYSYKSGDYFGELALLKDIPRQASVVAMSDVKLITLTRVSFKRMLGPLEEILKRNEERYAKYSNK